MNKKLLGLYGLKFNPFCPELPASAFWSYVIWGQTLGWMAWTGMGLIVVAGTVIALGGRKT